MSVTLKRLIHGWNQFWFSESSTHAMGIFRIALGLQLLFTFAISFPNWQRFYGLESVCPLELYESGMGQIVNLFSISTGTLWVWAIYWGALVVGLSFTLGFGTRVCTVLLFLITASLNHRCRNLVNGQDQVVQLLLFFSIFYPLGRSYSLDRLIALRSGRAVAEVTVRWPRRLMQVSLALIYLWAGITKPLLDEAWLDGSAMYYVSNSATWFRFSGIPFLHSYWLTVVETYVALAAEILFPILVWVPALRIPLVVLMTGFHLATLVLLELPVFLFNSSMVVFLVVFYRE